jgi:hypothetical protein
MGLDIRQIITTVRHVSPANPDEFDLEQVINLLLCGDIELEGQFTWSSNYTFLVKLTRPASPEKLPGLVDMPPPVEVVQSAASSPSELLAVYKPGRGERPLWDFPDGTLGQREFAAYLVSRVLGWPRVPPTVFREDGPHGPGSVQLFIDADYEEHYFNLRDLPAYTEDFRRMALFDDIVNNADRKGGHCLKDKNDRIWAIDHGLTFHPDRKLRTVIWEFADEEIASPLWRDLKRLRSLLEEPGELYPALAQVLAPAEMSAFKRRIDRLLKTGRFPAWVSGRYNVPYPPL